mmetsp:Transcript_21163/g.45943  ORF Transcript_21163/g.45943 Transcript_21163/m.45943 type:complete len:274 (-) Transcript_21163:61-882(-)
MGIGALLPFARGHTREGSVDHEPWSFGPEIEATCQTALARRYRLLPWMYTLFYNNSVDGTPIMLPLFALDTSDRSLRRDESGFILGSSLLVERAGAQCGRPLGPAEWAPASVIDNRYLPQPPSMKLLPSLFLRRGRILPLARVSQHVGELLDQSKPWVEEVVIHLDDTGRATGELYQDAGDGFGYTIGEHRVVHFTASRSEDSVVKITAAWDSTWRGWDVATNLYVSLVHHDQSQTYPRTFVALDSSHNVEPSPDSPLPQKGVALVWVLALPL